MVSNFASVATGCVDEMVGIVGFMGVVRSGYLDLDRLLLELLKWSKLVLTGRGIALSFVDLK